MTQSLSKPHTATDALDRKLDLMRRLPSPKARRAIRLSTRATGRDCARALGVSDMTLSRWERGERTPRGENLERYVALLERLRRDAG